MQGGGAPPFDPLLGVVIDGERGRLRGQSARTLHLVCVVQEAYSASTTPLASVNTMLCTAGAPLSKTLPGPCVTWSQAENSHDLLCFACGTAVGAIGVNLRRMVCALRKRSARLARLRMRSSGRRLERRAHTVRTLVFETQHNIPAPSGGARPGVLAPFRGGLFSRSGGLGDIRSVVAFHRQKICASSAGSPFATSPPSTHGAAFASLTPEQVVVRRMQLFDRR
jgi:hypothetical protein